MKSHWFVDAEGYICCEGEGKTTRMFLCAEGIDPHEVVIIFNDAQRQYEEEAE